MKLGYLGGTFDPIHNGHIALARAALKQLRLDQVLFVPTDVPPHKRRPLTPFIHRYAMLVLALAEAREPRFLPSLIEAPTQRRGPRYSIETIRVLQKGLGAGSKIFFLIGIDAFLEIASWRRPEALLRQCEFVVSSRPGYSLNQAAAALPESLRQKPIHSNHKLHRVELDGVTIHLLEGVNVPVSATELRAQLRSKISARSQSLRKLLPDSVLDYIKKMHLYEVG
jgi:nicotinate-nucleotide adenylyltransferase